jgi:hypothetical protein
MIDAEKAEYEDVLRRLTAKCEELVAENARLPSDKGVAMSFLEEVINDPNASPSLRVKAAGLVLPHQVPRLMPEPRPLDLVANEKIEPLAELVHRRRRRADALENLPLGHPEHLRWIERADGTYPADDDTPNG